MEALKVEISVMKKTAAERRENLLKETETHVQIRKDIEVRKFWNPSCSPLQILILQLLQVCFQIQNRRFEAVVRRLQLQLSRAQTAHRYGSRTSKLEPASVILTPSITVTRLHLQAGV